MRKSLKIFLRIIGGIFLFVMLFIIVMPLLFKDEILETVRQSVDRQIEGAFYFEEADVGILKTFPNLCLELRSPVLTGGTHPEGDSLFTAELLGVVVDMKSLLRRNSPIKVIGVELRSPRVSLYTGADGDTNYDLVSQTDTLTPPADTLEVNIEKYTLKNASMRFLDRANDVEIIANGLNHQGRLDYRSEMIEMRTETEEGILTIKSEGISYLNGVRIAGQNAVNIDLVNSIYTLSDNTISLNALQVDLDGTIAQSNKGTEFQLSFSGERNAFKNLISLLPYMYTEEFDDIRASGNIALSGTLEGTMSESTVPVYRINLRVDSGAFQYPGKPLGFEDVAFDGNLYNSSRSWVPVEINLPSLHFELNDRPFDARLKILNPADNGSYSGTLKGIVDLADLYRAYPFPHVTALKGIVDADVAFDIGPARSASDQNVSGSLRLQDIAGRTVEEQVDIQSGTVEFTPAVITTKTQTARWNTSPIALDLRISDYIGWLTNNQQMRVSGNISMGKFDANKYIKSEGAISSADTAGAFDPGLSLIRYEGSITVDTLIYDTYVVADGSAALSGTLKSIDLSAVRGKIKGTQFSGHGTITDVHRYLDGTSPLSGALDCTMDHLYLDQWIEAEERASESSTAKEASYLAFPDDLKLDITFRASELEYDKIRVRNPHGRLHLEDRILEIHEFNGEGMGGNIAFSGVYNTQDIVHPAFSMKYDLRSMRFAQFFEQVETFQVLAPIAELVQGVFNSAVVVDGRLGKNYMPDFSTLSASGFIETLSGSVEKAALLDKLSQFLNLNTPLDWDLANTKNWFEVKDGYVELQEMNTTIDNIEVALSGRHQIEGEMEYMIKLNIPAERISANPVGSLARAGYEQLQSKAASFGVKLNTVESFVVHVGIRGMLSDPKFQVLLFDASGKSLKEVASDQVEELKEQVRDTVTALVDAKVQEVRDSLREIIDTAVDSARRAAEEKLREAGKEIVSESAAKLDSTIRDSITNAVLDKLGQKEQDKIKEALDKFDPFKKKKNND